jgi:hypothetical protein
MTFDGIRIDIRFRDNISEELISEMAEEIKNRVIEYISEEQEDIKSVDSFLFKQV